VDEIGDLDFAIKTAAKMVGIKEEPEVVTKKERLPLLDLLTGRIYEGAIKLIPSIELKYMFMPS
jgi:ClpP class serine protease